MKVWLKYLIGTVLGVLAAFILPMDIPSVNSFVASASELAIRFGRYAILPFLVFGVSMAFFNLRVNKRISKTALWTAGTIGAGTLILVLLGLLSILIFKLPRIPITGEKMTKIPVLDIKNLIMMIFPYSGFDVLKDGAYLLPAFIFAGLAGAAGASDTAASRPVIQVLEAASKICYSIVTFFVEWLSVGMIAIAAYWIFQAKTVFATSTFVPVFIMLLVDFVLLTCLIYPLILRFFCKDLRPFHVLYASICPILCAFFSGDSNVSMFTALRHGKESLGIQDEVNNFTFPLFSVFSRGGTSLVISICFVTILRSYTDLGFAFVDVLWIFVSTFAISFVLGALPQGGTFVALIAICSMYGRGFGEGYLLLRPAVPLICSFAAAFDVVNWITGSYIVGVKTKLIEHQDIRHYI
ncbi:MAG: dicarboxylate/amino acid:cation symporter [Treponema sp.]|nr:dicarboxylate/amino acid:cation symporter [Candidatus Treponema equifaecale]